MKLLEQLLLEISEIKYQHLFNLFKSKLGFSDTDDNEEITFILRLDVGFDRADKENTTTLKKLFNSLVVYMDVTKSKYTQWLTNSWIKELKVEDGKIIYDGDVSLTKIGEAIALHNRLKNSSDFDDTLKDITKLSLEEFTNAIFKWNETTWKTKSTIDLVKERLDKDTDYTIEYVDEEWMLFKIESREGSMVLGAHASWCTSAGEGAVNPERRGFACYYESYAGKDSRLYVILNKKYKDKLFQLYIKNNKINEFKTRTNSNTMLTDIKILSSGILNHIVVKVLHNNISSNNTIADIVVEDLEGSDFLTKPAFTTDVIKIANFFTHSSDTHAQILDAILYSNAVQNDKVILTNGDNLILDDKRTKILKLDTIENKIILDKDMTKLAINALIGIIKYDKLTNDEKSILSNIHNSDVNGFPSIMEKMHELVKSKNNTTLTIYAESYNYIKCLMFYYIINDYYLKTLIDRMILLLTDLVKLKHIKSFTNKSNMFTIYTNNENEEIINRPELIKTLVTKLPYDIKYYRETDNTKDIFKSKINIDFEEKYGIRTLIPNIKPDDLTIDNFKSIYKEEFNNIYKWYEKNLSNMVDYVITWNLSQ